MYKRVTEIILSFSVLASIMVLFQFAFYFFRGSYISFFPSNLMADVITSNKTRMGYLASGNASGYFRPAGVFIEPAHFAQYVSMGLAVSIFRLLNDFRNKWFFVSAFMTLAMFISTSGIGFVSALVLWGIYFLMRFRKMSLKSYTETLLIIIIFLFIMVLLLPRMEFMKTIISRLLTSNNESAVPSAVSGRAGGYVSFSEMGLIEKIFGVGLGNEDNTVFHTFLSANLARTGFAGCFLLAMWCLSSISHTDNIIKIAIAPILIILAGANTQDFANMLFYFYIIFCGTYKKNRCCEYLTDI